ncbi:18441_t:CDS:2, partial [Gigaspora margarita]
ILRPVMEMARQMNIRLVAYLDDILIMAKSHKQARANKEKLVDLLYKMGWDSVVHLSFESKQKLLQWIEQLTHHKGRKVSVELPSMIIQTDALLWDNFEGIDTMETTMQPDNYHKIRLYDHSSTPSQEDEQTGRYSITNDKSTIGMDFVETNVQHTTADLGVPEYQSICNQQEHSNEEIFQLEIRPSGISNRCIYPTLEGVESVCKSTMDFITQSISQDSPRESHSDTDFPVMAFSSLVPNTNGSSSRYSNNVTSQSNLSRGNYTSQKSQVENLRSTYIRKQLKDKGFLDRAAELYISSYDPKASESVSACMRKWFNWCASGGHDPIRCPLQTIVEFLDDLYNQNMQYNMIASYRSAISEVHTPVEEKAIVDVLLTMDYIQSLGSNSEMTILNLAQKMALLLALTVSVTIRNPKEAKISRAHRGIKEQNKTLFIGSYPEDKAFCALSAFNTYRAQTSEWRTSHETQKSLFLTTTMPHRPASTDSIARWIKLCLTKSSEDLTAKDTRVILAFLAQNSGADLATIMALGNWS